MTNPTSTPCNANLSGILASFANFSASNYADLGKYQFYKSYIPIFTPSEVEYCEKFDTWFAGNVSKEADKKIALQNIIKGNSGAEFAAASGVCSSGKIAELQATTDSCKVILDSHLAASPIRRWGFPMLMLLAAAALRLRNDAREREQQLRGPVDTTNTWQPTDRERSDKPLQDDSKPAGRRERRKDRKAAARGKETTTTADVKAAALDVNADHVWRDSPNRIKGGWLGFGSIPHTNLQPGTKFILNALREAASKAVDGATSPFTALEIGSGMGLLAERVAKFLKIHVIGSDVRPMPPGFGYGMPNIEFRQASAKALPAEDSSIGAIFSSFAWEYVGVDALKEAWRALVPGAPFIAVSHHMSSTTTRNVIAGGQMAARVLELFSTPAHSNKKHRLYQNLWTDLTNNVGLEGNAFERHMQKNYFMQMTRAAYFGKLNDQMVFELQLQMAAGKGLEWFASLSEIDIRRLFEENGFEVQKIESTSFRLLGGILPVTTHQGLGIVATKIDPALGVEKMLGGGSADGAASMQVVRGAEALVDPSLRPERPLVEEIRLPGVNAACAAVEKAGKNGSRVEKK